MSEEAQRIVDEHLDEMMSPREYVATRKALIDAVGTALAQARRDVCVKRLQRFVK